MGIVYNSIIYIAIISLISLLGKLISPVFYFIFLFPTIKFILCNQHKKVQKIIFLFFSNLAFFAIFFYWFIDIYGVFKFFTVCIFYAFVFLFPFFIFFKNRIPYYICSIIFMSAWIVIEYTIIHTDFLPPFVILGNTLHPLIMIIQFYEYTGVFGGTLWILLVNCMFFNVIAKQGRQYSLMIVCISIIFPVGLSKNLLNKYKNLTLKKINVGALHLNNKSNSLNDINELKMILRDIDLNDSTILVFPENAITNKLNICDLSEDIRLFFLSKTLRPYPFSSIIIGADLEKNINIERHPLNYNVGIVINKNGYNVIYKQKFVPFDENIPELIRFFTGQSKYYHTQSGQKYYCNSNENIGVAICYEILYGNYVANQIGENIGLLTLMTKESGLKDNSFAKNQYLGIATIRAIEMRKTIVKSSTKGYTSIIGLTGEILSTVKPSDDTQLIKADVELNHIQTFYTRFGDIIPILSISFLVIILLYNGRKKFID
ncbi:nitrilase-related carbon-nitrogen hydrolase [Carboxylicivirga sp. RSCT41]|uniref:nitrilase-related carbon-nitrogen hydrolase n=1 Tax=Carboxylicivirga agarovorans TaxID=3417570 RepID=UPI003D332DE2